jgi:protein-L-isoaspartate(D-aspartate) O-methyltransferase
MNKNELIATLRQKGFPEKIIEAFAKVNRENFVSDDLKNYAYEDAALPIAEGQTISQPSTIAFMLELLELEKGQKILEIGSGTGYVLALLSEITGGEVYGIEIKENSAIKAREQFANNANIKIINKNGSYGLPEHAPFDRIIISACCPSVETVNELIPQLKDTGIIIAPVKDSLVQIKKSGTLIEKHEFPGFVFVPLVGETL